MTATNQTTPKAITTRTTTKAPGTTTFEKRYTASFTGLRVGAHGTRLLKIPPIGGPFQVEVFQDFETQRSYWRARIVGGTRFEERTATAETLMAKIAGHFTKQLTEWREY